jgi:DtxR family Mn-dependent transcriptional regulator
MKDVQYEEAMPTTESAEMYLKTIYELEADDEPVAISQVAERLGISSVSANEMVKRLVERDLLVHMPYKGVNLTDEGRRRALNVVRHHRLWERFMVDRLGLAWEDVHDAACRLEHATTNEVAEALADFLGQPTTCPHGNPIPSPDGVLAESGGTPLSELDLGEGGVVECVRPESAILLNYLAERGVKPGEPVLVEDIAPFNGPLTVRIGQARHVLGREVAVHVLIATGDKRQAAGDE